MSEHLQAELDRCDAEIASHEALLRAGHQDMDGLLAALHDWASEKRRIQNEIDNGKAAS